MAVQVAVAVYLIQVAAAGYDALRHNPHIVCRTLR
jgi:hypothetical protein